MYQALWTKNKVVGACVRWTWGERKRKRVT